MLPILLLAFIAIFFCAFMMGIAYFFAAKDQKGRGVKKEDYECGLVPTQKKTFQMPVKFFLTAILFILFDIEIIFLYPFAIAYRDFIEMDSAGSILMAMVVFLILFLYGLWWEIKTKALNWK